MCGTMVVVVWIYCIYIYTKSDGLQPTSDGLQPNSNVYIRILYTNIAWLADIFTRETSTVPFILGEDIFTMQLIILAGFSRLRVMWRIYFPAALCPAVVLRRDGLVEGLSFAGAGLSYFGAVLFLLFAYSFGSAYSGTKSGKGTKMPMRNLKEEAWFVGNGTKGSFVRPMLHDSIITSKGLALATSFGGPVLDGNKYSLPKLARKAEKLC